jgi:formylglycine-generating enzyme required for sulfatase activity
MYLPNNSLPKHNFDLLLEENAKLHFIYCPVGTFTFRKRDAKPPFVPEQIVQRPMEQGFWITDTPITQHQWKQVMGKSFQFFGDNDNLPVSRSTWFDAIEFCERLTVLSPLNNAEFNLPTPDQWEYACRADTYTTWFFGDNPERLIEFAWCFNDFASRELRQIQPVATKKPNPWGLYDLYGNVQEWCLDEKATLGEILTSGEKYSGVFMPTKGGDVCSSSYHCDSSKQRFWDTLNAYSEEIGFRIVINPL